MIASDSFVITFLLNFRLWQIILPSYVYNINKLIINIVLNHIYIYYTMYLMFNSIYYLWENCQSMSEHMLGSTSSLKLDLLIFNSIF